jgi:hypothetical protein
MKTEKKKLSNMKGSNKIWERRSCCETPGPRAIEKQTQELLLKYHIAHIKTDLAANKQ